MKAWILAAVVAVAVLVLVGVPAVALTLNSHDGDGRSTASVPQRHHGKGPDGHHWMGKHDQRWGPHGMRPGPGHRAFPMHKFPMQKLSAKQRDALADRFDDRAAQLHKAATCLRQRSDATQCLKRSFGRGGVSPRPPRG